MSNLDLYTKACKVIDSCETLGQLEVATKYVDKLGLMRCLVTPRLEDRRFHLELKGHFDYINDLIEETYKSVDEEVLRLTYEAEEHW